MSTFRRARPDEAPALLALERTASLAALTRLRAGTVPYPGGDILARWRLVLAGPGVTVEVQDDDARAGCAAGRLRRRLAAAAGRAADVVGARPRGQAMARAEGGARGRRRDDRPAVGAAGQRAGARPVRATRLASHRGDSGGAVAAVPGRVGVRRAAACGGRAMTALLRPSRRAVRASRWQDSPPGETRWSASTRPTLPSPPSSRRCASPRSPPGSSTCWSAAMPRRWSRCRRSVPRCAAQATLDAAQLRELTKQRRQLTAAVTGRARALAAEERQRVTVAVAEQVEGTLTTAMVDEGAERAVRSGLLVAALAATGVDAVDVAAAVALPAALGFTASPQEAAPSAPTCTWSPTRMPRSRRAPRARQPG
ncbi:MAG: hypothetical protein R2734_15820 [Nocardioides sp.]